MSALAVVLPGLLLGVVVSIPLGPAGVIILHRSLRDEKAEAARAVAAFLAAELLALAVAVTFLERMTWLAALPWMKCAAGAYLILFAASAWRGVGAERGFSHTTGLGVFRVTVLNPAIWIGAVSTLTVARATGGEGIFARILFVAAVETGCLAWYLAVLLGARKVPAAARHHVERAALLLIAGTGVWLAASVL
jgi:arginine exporter protein ArgO